MNEVLLIKYLAILRV